MSVILLKLSKKGLQLYDKNNISNNTIVTVEFMTIFISPEVVASKSKRSDN